MIMHIDLEFRNASQVLPRLSGRYVCLTGHTMQTLFYSARWNRFNVTDSMDSPRHALKVNWWAPIPSPLRNYI